jgi:DNA (cytosine-5)-methyltransferase 1
MAAYYNEFDPYAAQWLRDLIEAGHIAPGIVDERSIEDVHPSDLHGFTQCHFFAGIGVWSLALRRAGWADDRPVWTGSCPCQPFSAAGAGAGFADARHLWPTFAWLIKQCKPSVVFGEQVASKAVEPWVDLVHADVEALGYAFGAIPFPSAGVGAPHIRDRLFWVADSKGHGHERTGKLGKSTGRNGAAHMRSVGGLANSNGGHSGAEREQRCGEQRFQSQDGGGDRLESGRVDDAAGSRHQRSVENPEGDPRDQTRLRLSGEGHGQDQHGPAGPVNGLWRNADWLSCRDGKWRPVRPGTFPLAHGAPSRVGRLRAYGNAINAEAATQFIAAYLET